MADRKRGQHGYSNDEVVGRVMKLMKPGETQEEFADRINVDRTAISKWKSENKISLYSLVKISRATGASLDYLVWGTRADRTHVLDELSESVRNALNRAYELASERKRLELVKLDEPPPPDDEATE